MSAISRLCVFCGSSSGARPSYRAGAETLGRLLVERDIELVYGGGDGGLMGVIATTVMQGGGRVTGVIPADLFSVEIDAASVTELHRVGSMHERKALMYDLADAFIALPGGLGTLEEVAEALTWNQIGLHDKPLGLLDVEGFWSGLGALLDHMTQEGFVKARNLDRIRTDPDPARLLDAL